MRARELLEGLNEKSLSLPELSKRDSSWDELARRIQAREPFHLGMKGDQGEIIIDPQPELLQAISARSFEDTPYKQGRKVWLPVQGGGDVNLTSLYKDKSFGSTGSKENAERQESGLVDSINKAVEENGGSITLVTANENLEGVTGASKATLKVVLGDNGKPVYNKEPYADVAIKVGNKEVLVSAKATKSPSIAGGGLDGLNLIDPTIIEQPLHDAEDFFKKMFRDRAKEGKPVPINIPDIYSPIEKKYMKPILAGVPAMGGPIDYMYVGPMDVTSVYNNGVLKVDGKLTSIDNYITEVEELYLRIRKRRIDQPIVYDETDENGYPRVFGRGPETGERARRLVVYKKEDVPVSAVPSPWDNTVYTSRLKQPKGQNADFSAQDKQPQ